jgi:hypothetical protein
LLEQKSTRNISIANQKLKICLGLAMTQIYGKKTFDGEKRYLILEFVFQQTQLLMGHQVFYMETVALDEA